MKIKCIWIAIYFFSSLSFGASHSLYSEDLMVLLEDSDKDGVINARDLCENTKQGSKVDNDGCPEIYLESFHINFDVQFETDDYELHPQHYSALKDLAQFLQDYPETIVIIEGHTDNKGSRTHNLTLSEKRAESIAGALATNFDIDPNRIKTLGYGQEHPLSSNQTEAGRKANRRVIGEIIQPQITSESRSENHHSTFTIPFALNQFVSPKSHQAIIEKLANFLQINPSAITIIEGHTDSTGSPSINLALSKRRANQVADVLTDQFSILDDRIKAIGYGDSKPLQSNLTLEGRKSNRRVEIIIGERFATYKETPLPKWTIWSVDTEITPDD